MAIASSESSKSDYAGSPAVETCEACGSEFGCGASLAGCWCSEITLSDIARAELAKGYKRCLCRNCLEQIANGDGKNEEQTLG